MFLLPDTPRWYYARGRLEEADAILARLHDRPVSSPAVQAMRQSILSSLEHEAEETKSINFLDLIWDRSNLRVGRRIRISFMILSLQQMMGRLPLHHQLTMAHPLLKCYRNQHCRLLQCDYLFTNRPFLDNFPASRRCHEHYFRYRIIPSSEYN